MSDQVMSAEEIAEQEKLKAGLDLNFEEKKASTFTPLAEGQYEMSIIRTEVSVREDRFNPGEMETVLVVICSVDKFMMGDKIVDIEGNEYAPEERNHREWITVKKKSTKGEGHYLPEKSRKFFGALLNTDPDGELKLGHPDDLNGKKFRVFLEAYTKQDKTPGTKSLKYSACS